MTYDPKTVSKMLDLPGSTIRRYCADYSEFLSERATSPGRKHFFTDQDIFVLRAIRKYTRERKTPEYIKNALRKGDLQRPEDGSALAFIPQIYDEFQNLRGDITSLRDNDEDIRRRLKALEELEEERKQKKGFWRKLFGG